ncbi:MAG: MBL fold metallo-hydrolase [Anaerolineales bacterium]|nr:MBL fold metallo-hydrolase [Anaerolineales bacterium]
MKRLRVGVLSLVVGPLLGIGLILVVWVRRLKKALYWLGATLIVGGLGVAYQLLLAPMLQARKRAAQFYQRPGFPKDDGERIDLKPVKQLRIMPLIDFYAVADDLETEPGVSYLVRADETTILFDLGLNRRSEPVSPLRRNMERLGIDPQSVQAIVNSHTHGDHLGNWQNVPPKVLEQNPLRDKPLFTVSPVPALGEYPIMVRGPREIVPGVGVTGPLPSGLFLLNYTLEQSLVYHLDGKGLVVIIGCGHPGIRAIVERAQQVFQQPVYAVIGGLHLPIKSDRFPSRFFHPQKLVGGPYSYPWKPLGEDTVCSAIGYLKGKGVQVVSMSPHDSCDWSIEQFRAAFGENYRPVLVGQEIVLEAS